MNRIHTKPIRFSLPNKCPYSCQGIYSKCLMSALFPKAASKKKKNLVAEITFIGPHSSRAQKSKTKDIRITLSLTSLEENPSLPLFSFWCFAGNSWSQLAYKHITPISASTVTGLPLPSVSLSFSYKDTNHVGLGSTLRTSS